MYAHTRKCMQLGMNIWSDVYFYGGMWVCMHAYEHSMANVQMHSSAPVFMCVSMCVLVRMHVSWVPSHPHITHVLQITCRHWRCIIAQLVIMNGNNNDTFCLAHSLLPVTTIIFVKIKIFKVNSLRPRSLRVRACAFFMLACIVCV